MKLYLGCAEPPFHPQHYNLFPDLDEWVWVDKYIDHPQIKKWDATILDDVADNSVERIYASHLLEHFEHAKIPEILKLWYKKLTPQGRLTINVPDLRWAFKQFAKIDQGYLLDEYYTTYAGEHGLLSILYGSQSHEGEYHKSGFTEPYLRQLLEGAGFSHVSVHTDYDAHAMGILFAEAVK